MTPDTVHLIATLVRHQRGMVTAFEKWVQKQPPSPTCKELVQVISVCRHTLNTLEAQIEKFDVEMTDESSEEVVAV